MSNIAGHCPICGAPVASDYAETWCPRCVELLPEHVLSRLPRLDPEVVSAAAARSPVARGLQPAYREAVDVLLKPPQVTRQSTLMLVTLVLFLVVQFGVYGETLRNVAIVILVLLLHETGHLLAMRWFGYRDVRMLFLPFLGAAVIGRHTDVAAWREGVVALLGPIPGIVIGLVVAVAAGESPLVRELAWILVALNAFNLLPIKMLDGGRLFDRIVFSRHRYLEIAFAFVTAPLVLWLAWEARSPLLVFLALLGVGVVRGRTRMLASAANHRRAFPVMPSDPEKLDERQREYLFLSARAALSETPHATPTMIADTMSAILDARRPSPSLAASVLLFAAWGGALATALFAAVVLAVRAPADWAEWPCPGLGIAAQFPREPLVTREGVQGTEEPFGVCAVGVGQDDYQIIALAAGSAFAIDEQRRRLIAESNASGRAKVTDVVVDGMQAVDIDSDGQLTRIVFAGPLTFVMKTTSGRDDAQRFFGSFRLSGRIDEFRD